MVFSTQQSIFNVLVDSLGRILTSFRSQTGQPERKLHQPAETFSTFHQVAVRVYYLDVASLA